MRRLTALNLLPVTLSLLVLNYSPLPNLPPAIAKSTKSAFRTITPKKGVKAARSFEMGIQDRRIEAAKVSAQCNGWSYVSREEYKKATECFLKLLAEAQKSGDQRLQVSSLYILGWIYDDLGYYQKAIEAYQDALKIAVILQDKRAEADLLNLLAWTKYNLGQYELSIELNQKSVSLAASIDYQLREGYALADIGLSYRAIGKRQLAIDFLIKALRIAQSTNNLELETFCQRDLGLIHQDIGNHEQAIKYYEDSVKLAQAINRYFWQATVLNNLGTAFQATQKYQAALYAYQASLAISQKRGYRAVEAISYSNLGNLFAEQGQLDLAIVFYKKSVNVTQSIRKHIQGLSREQRETYTKTVAETYRSLANLLIQQGRLSEAQAVLELLKLRELREFTRDAGIDSDGILLAAIEEKALNQILNQFATVGSFTQELSNCQQTNCTNLKQLEQQRDALNAAIQQEIKQQRAILAKHFSTEAGTLTPDRLNAEARRIVNAQPGTILIYPLVLKDKVQFLVAFQAGDGAVTFRPFETQISAEQLFKTIQRFREQLGTPRTDVAEVQATSQQLYTWLIKPLETELNNPAIKHLVFAPDSTTRYIPLAALYDGKQYLIQRFTISTITAASQTDTEARTPTPKGQQPLLLAMGASTFPNLNPLEYVPAELDAITQTNAQDDIVGIYPGSKFLNQTFDYEALQTSLKKGTYRILHLATHGAFKPGRVEESYLVPGRGQNLTTELIDQLGNYGLSNIHLVVLSACETAVGDRASDGIEIPGISYFFLKNGVKSVLASLWNVNDASTALLMQQFYKNLATNKVSKAEALRQAQLSLLQGKLTAKDAPARADVEVTVAPGTRTVQRRSPNFAHPYYWAPFILIGNSL